MDGRNYNLAHSKWDDWKNRFLPSKRNISGENWILLQFLIVLNQFQCKQPNEIRLNGKYFTWPFWKHGHNRPLPPTRNSARGKLNLPIHRTAKFQRKNLQTLSWTFWRRSGVVTIYNIFHNCQYRTLLHPRPDKTLTKEEAQAHWAHTLMLTSKVRRIMSIYRTGIKSVLFHRDDTRKIRIR